MERYLAHISEDGIREQTVREHLIGTAELAARFGAAFGAEQDAYYMAILHDIGKYSAQFQKRIHGANIRVDHSTAGARELFRHHQSEAAFAVAGHHGGIPNGGNYRNDTCDSHTFFGRIKKEIEDYSPWQELQIKIPVSSRPRYTDMLEESFYIRMLYSCLVDADYLDTERFMRGMSRGEIDSKPIKELLKIVQAKAERWLSVQNPGKVDSFRNRVLRECTEHGRTWEPGLFTLTVPTGGGKTFASLAFALEHAASWGKKRIIYVIPYTSIIDQTEDKFSELLGKENVLAHYASVDYRVKDPDAMTPLDYQKQLAAENYDCPIVVTTAVQFFESLYSNRPSKCRKLHNLANSVLIFDEAQSFPIPYLSPCVAAIAMLVKDYGASAVLCTATQPALASLFQEYALPLREIVSDPEKLAENMRRFTLHDLEELSTEQLAQHLSAHNQVLCVVNQRKTAQELFAMLPEEGRYCLTTLLCPLDRKRLLKEIRRRLVEGQPCRVVSTSLIEAGVDVDFPAAYREKTGLDSILQTGGRCNREGRNTPENSIVYIFKIHGKAVPAMLRQNLNALQQAAEDFQGELNSLRAIQKYFETLRLIKGNRALDSKGVLSAFSTESKCLFPFEKVAEDFRLIETPSKVVYLPIEEKGKELCDCLLAGRVGKKLMRWLGPYSVTVYPKEYEALVQSCAVIPVCEDGGVLNDLVSYSREIGLTVEIVEGQAFIV